MTNDSGAGDHEKGDPDPLRDEVVHDGERYLTVAAAATESGVQEMTIRRRIRRGHAKVTRDPAVLSLLPTRPGHPVTVLVAVESLQSDWAEVAAAPLAPRVDPQSGDDATTETARLRSDVARLREIARLAQLAEEKYEEIAKLHREQLAQFLRPDFLND